jgi:L-arabinose isomerase
VEGEEYNESKKRASKYIVFFFHFPYKQEYGGRALREQLRKPRMGLLLIGAERFCNLGEGTARGTYLKRKQDEAAWMLADCRKIADVTFPGIIFTREDVISAMEAFISFKVDYVLAIYLSWAEDFAWNRFLRDMPPVPVLFAHRMRDEINLKDTHDSDEFTEYLCCGGHASA